MCADIIAQQDDVVSAARRLAPSIVSAREETEAARRTPPAIARSMAAAGHYQMFVPRSLGGPELDPLTAFRAIEELSKADGSVGWVAMILSDISLFSGWLPAEVGRAIAGQPADLRVAGSLRPQGRAWPAADGYRVRGQWNFASGIDIANWLYAPCVIMEGDNPQMTPAGTPRVRAMWVPVDAARIIDTWSVIGMRGTGSQDFALDDVHVPAERTCFIAEPAKQAGPLYNPRTVMALLWTLTAANALGIARGAIDDFIALADKEGSTQSPVLLSDRASVQSDLGNAEAIVGAARAYVMEAVGSAWHVLSSGSEDPTRFILQARLAVTHAMHEAVRAVDRVFHAAGSSAIHGRNPLERHFRDIHVAVQHNSAFRTHYESAGKALLGRKPDGPGW